MRKKYGQTYKVAEFIGKLLRKRGVTTSEDRNYVHACIEFLKQLDLVQDSHPFITLSFSAADGLWVFYKGESLLFIKPTQKYLFLHVFKENDLSKRIDRQKKLFKNVIQTEYAHRQWHIGATEMVWLIDYLKGRPQPSGKTTYLGDRKHSRYIPGHVRQAALDDFLSSGRQCPGASSRKAHKVPQNGLIEFDHVLPHADGGPNTYTNIQVLCMECNRVKSRSAR